MSDLELDRLLASPLPDTGANDLADRVAAQLVAEQERRDRFRIGVTSISVVAVVALFAMTSVGQTLGNTLMDNPIAEALGIAFAAILFSFTAVQWIEDWVTLR